MDRLKELNKLPKYNYKKGIPIGNMTSQILAVYYLNETDHFIKENLKCKRYIRYMDDLVIIDNDKNKLINVFESVKKYIEKYKLCINNKSNIFKNNISFLGYKFEINKCNLIIKYNKKTIKKIKNNLKYLKYNNYSKYLKAKESYNGYFMKGSTKYKYEVKKCF